jgi:hypothetical protein
MAGSLELPEVRTLSWLIDNDKGRHPPCGLVHAPARVRAVLIRYGWSTTRFLQGHQLAFVCLLSWAFPSSWIWKKRSRDDHSILLTEGACFCFRLLFSNCFAFTKTCVEHHKFPFG